MTADEPTHVPQPPREFAMARRYVVLLAIATAGFVGATIRAVAGPGRLLLAVAAIATLAMVLRGALLRPTLRLDNEGLAVVQGLRRRRFTWAEIDAVRTLPPAGRFSAMGRDALEIDLSERLVVVAAIWLGTAAADVAAAATSIRAAQSS
ncbi:MAG: PH domain-containing protein [Mycobacteriales bacterium]|nr:PH domain-containing protein [Frankia sp.]